MCSWPPFTPPLPSGSLSSLGGSFIRKLVSSLEVYLWTICWWVFGHGGSILDSHSCFISFPVQVAKPFGDVLSPKMILEDFDKAIPRRLQHFEKTCSRWFSFLFLFSYPQNFGFVIFVPNLRDFCMSLFNE